MKDLPKDAVPEESGPATEWVGLGLAWREASPIVLGPVDTAEIARRAGRFARTIRMRNAGEWLACVGLVGAGIYGMVERGSLLEGAMYLAMIAVAVWVAATIFVKGRNLSPPLPTATTAAFLAYERSQLARQRTLLANVRRWYLGPLAAVVAIVVVVAIVEARAHGVDLASPRVLGTLGAVLAFEVTVFVGLDRRNARAARELGERLAKLGDG